jgi:NitT/TauT family transport system permease protein
MLKRLEILAPALSFAVALLLWQFGPPLFGIPSYVIPTVTEILDAVTTSPEIFLDNSWTTLIEAATGCAIGCAFGFALGCYMAESRLVSRIFLPYVIGSNAVPVVAVAPLIVLWFGYGTFSKSIVAAFLSFFPITIKNYQGLSEYDAVFSELFIILGASRWEFFLKFKLVNALPHSISGLKVSGTLAVIGAVVAEFVSPQAGLGFGMLQATYNLDTPRLFGYLVISCLMGMTMYGIGALIESLWQRKLYPDQATMESNRFC